MTTSSGKQPVARDQGRRAPVDFNQGVSVTKMKGERPEGDPVSIKDVKRRRGQTL